MVAMCNTNILYSTNVPSIAMSFSDIPFPYGPFVPHYIPRQYIESYVSHHQIDNLISFNTTVEDVSKITSSPAHYEKWKLTLRKHDDLRNVDEWWEEEFDAVILANGHYSVPFVRYLLYVTSRVLLMEESDAQSQRT